MLKPVEVPEHLRFLVKKQYVISAAGRDFGEIAVLKDGRIMASTSREFETLKAAERWLKLI